MTFCCFLFPLQRFCPTLHELHVEKLLQIVNHERRETRSVEQLQALRISLITPISLDPHQLCGLLQDYGKLTRVFLHRCYIANFKLRDLIFSGTFSKLETFQPHQKSPTSGEGAKQLSGHPRDSVSFSVAR